MTRRAHAVLVVALGVLALLHVTVYAAVVPIWQAPDEPMLFEYAALAAQLGRVPGLFDHSPAIEQRITSSLNRQDFWRYTLGRAPTTAPQTLEAANLLFWMPRQVGGDPPAYFVLAGFVLRGLEGLPIEQQAYILRFCNALLAPLIVLCAYGAVREVLGERYVLVPIAVAGLVALQPMFAAANSAVGNDALANLIGAGVCWVWLRMLRLGRSWRRIGALLALVVVGLLTKRTLLPYVALFAGAGLVWLIGAIWRKGWGARGVALAVVLIAGAGLGGWSVRQLNQQAAWGWYLWGGHQQVVRVAAADGPALMIPAGQIAAYQVPAAAGERAKQSLLHFGARISSSDGGRGRLVVLNDQKRHEIRFIADKRADSVDTSATIYPETRGVVLAIQADKGTLQIDQIWATSGTTPIIFPDALAIPGIRAGSPLLTVVQYLRLPELLWTLAIGPHVGALPAGWWALFFASFWGHFGWLSVPFVLDSAWAWALGLFCVLGLLGLPRALMQADRITRLQLLSFVGLALVAVILPLLNALAMPASLSIQQGRYLFPILVPFALLVARGQSALLPARAQKFWLAVWLIFLAIVALGALVRVYGYYHTIG